MMFSFLGRSSSSSSSQQAPWREQQPFLTQGFQGAQNWLQNQQANPNQNVLQGQQAQLDNAASGFGGAIPSAQATNQMFSNTEMLHPGSNPYLQGTIDNLGQNVTQQMQRNNNTINQNAAGAGNFGGSRQGVAQGLNAESANRQFQQGTNQILMDNYNQSLNRMQQQQQFLPQLAQLSSLPGMTQENIGNAQRNQEMDDLQRYWQIVGGNNWGGQGSSSSRQQASPLDMFRGFASGISSFF